MGVGVGMRGQIDDEVVDRGAFGPTFDDVHRDDVRFGQAHGRRDGAQTSGSIGQNQSDQVHGGILAHCV